MEKKETNTFLDKEILKKSKPIIKKSQYTMDFGEVAIQYDYCLN